MIHDRSPRLESPLDHWNISTGTESQTCRELRTHSVEREWVSQVENQHLQTQLSDYALPTVMIIAAMPVVFEMRCK